MATNSSEAGGTPEREAALPEQPARGKTGRTTSGKAAKPAAKPDGRKRAAATKTGSAAGTKAKAGTKAGAKAASGAAKPDGRKRATTAKGDGRKRTSTRKPTAEARTASEAGLRRDLREFVQAHPGGWGHNEWIGLVNLLKDRGHDTSDTDAVGMALERERLTIVLERVPGLGPRRVQAIADRYPRVWNVMQAGAEEIAMAANLPRAVAQRVKDALP